MIPASFTTDCSHAWVEAANTTAGGYVCLWCGVSSWNYAIKDNAPRDRIITTIENPP